MNTSNSPSVATPINAVPPVASRKRVGYDKTVGEETWLTPESIVKALGPFDLDPATPEAGMPWKTAPRMLKPSDDGLAHPWPQSEFVWHNPPYGKVLGRWLRKAAAHGNGITLIFARIETKAFFEHVWRHPNVTAILVPEGRIRFCRADGDVAGSAGAPSVFIGYGELAKQRLIGAVKTGALKGRLIILGEDQREVWQLGRAA